MQAKVNSTSISVRDFQEGDIPFVLNYWFHSPEGFVESMGANPQKMGSEDQMEKGLRNKVLQNRNIKTSKLNALTITHNGKPIGVHVINPLVENDHGIFHAHIWEPTMRRKGVGVYSYPQALKVFMDRFNLKKIVFKTPVQNTGALRVKEKLGIRCIGEEVIGFGIIKDGTVAKVFELRREEIRRAPYTAFQESQFYDAALADANFSDVESEGMNMTSTPLAEFTRFVIILDKVPDSETSRETIQRHIHHLKLLDQQGKLVLSGPFTDHASGMVIIKARDRAEAVAIANSDPFVSEGVRTQKVYTWQLACAENNYLG